ncbi:hypothetical protein LIPSTDRAFT_121036 [Lipomyces starkeyi NRRL Y-11557]|uniref:Major facilitator superfamily (MFS) profile domain-containing protein n=1 Tax=Lipomyces starkeyi NRRL Y-11557 TaxID=675824 RepID=A0A1E3PTX6_LIPST|nr:hypothetical protein LIPSTDRAFT_121036 [Lipomyces starkeyi NRRL Y-11557]
MEKNDTNADHEEQIEVQIGRLANQEDREVSKWEAIKQNPWNFVWCIYAVWTVLLVSFENQASGNILGIPEFRKDFGSYYDGNWVLDSRWQSAFSGAPTASSVVGALGSGQIADWIGRKKLVMISLALSFAAITMKFIAPLALRGLLTCLTALSFSFGPFTVAFIVNSTGAMSTRWAYRAVFCAQYGFAVVSAILVFFMPESPWWHVSKGNETKALNEKRLAVIKLTLEEIRSESEGVTYLECFRRSNLRRTLISIAPLSIQSLSGIVFASSNSTYYMQLAGYSDLTFYGLLVLTCILCVMGDLAVSCTPGAIKAYTIVSEVATSRLRVKTIAIGLALQAALNTMWSFVLPYIFNPNQANLGAKVDFWWTLPCPPRKFKGYKTDAETRGEAAKKAIE